MEKFINNRTFPSYNGSFRDLTVTNSTSVPYLSQRHAINTSFSILMCDNVLRRSWLILFLVSLFCAFSVQFETFLDKYIRKAVSVLGNESRRYSAVGGCRLHKKIKSIPKIHSAQQPIFACGCVTKLVQ
jgi:hypothetical protein